MISGMPLPKRSLDGAPGASSSTRPRRVVEVGGVSLLLYGRLDCLKAGEIIDIKFTKSYDAGKIISAAPSTPPTSS